VAPKLAPLLDAVPVNLAVSLHATTDALRDRLVPLNRHFPLAALLGALRALPAVTPRRPVFFEYTLMDGVNDSLEDAHRLARLLRPLPSKVNLIPMNPHQDSRERPPPPERVERFAAELARAGTTVTVRRPRGTDIAAACGQLAARRLRPLSEPELPCSTP
jgi:23S rRNA (adenine2503-C2)-methyltransferase